MGSKTAHVIGLQRSGQAAVRRLSAHGWNVVASDGADSDELREVADELSTVGADVYLGGHSDALKIIADLAVVSPGIPMNAPVIEECRRQGVPVVSELEVGWMYTKGRIVAVTGSNGKSTTTALLAHIFEGTGRPTFCCGNIGLPLSAVADQTTDDSLLAVEVSSYQLATIDRFRPDVGILLNITPDHLQWHGGFDNYKQAKARLWRNQTQGDWMVYFADDPEVLSLIGSIKSHSIPFSIQRELMGGTFLDENEYRGDFKI